MPEKKIIAVGGMGGSGTRLIATLLESAGIFMGECMNQAHDNLIFTALFRDIPYDISEKQIRYHYKIFITIMQGCKLPDEDLNYFLSFIEEKKHLRNIALVYQYIKNYNKSNIKKTGIWGWKEPNTSIFLSRLLEIDDDLIYVHVIRHGLDMAFNSKKTLSKRWAKLITGREYDESPQFQLSYWVNLNKEVQMLMIKYPKRIFLLNYDSLCRDYSLPLKELFVFMGFNTIPLNENDLKVIQVPESSGRYQNYDISNFSEEDLYYVRNLGFKI